MGLIREQDPILFESFDDFADRYSAVCDVLWRFHCAEQGWEEPDDGSRHSSAECREWGQRIFDALGIDHVDYDREAEMIEARRAWKEDGVRRQS